MHIAKKANIIPKATSMQGSQSTSGTFAVTTKKEHCMAKNPAAIPAVITLSYLRGI